MKKSILILTPDYYPENAGGCGISAYLLKKQLTKRKYGVVVFVFHSLKRKVLSENIFFNFGLYKVPLINNVLATVQLLWKYRDRSFFDYTVVHTYIDLLPAAVIFSKIAKIKVVVTLNNPKGAKILQSNTQSFFSYFNQISSYIVLRLFKDYVDHYVALTQSVKNIYTNAGYSNITLVPNMIDSDFVKKNTIQNKTFDFIYSGQLSRKKGIMTLLQAFRVCQKIHKGASLIIVGDGKMKQDVISFISENKLKNILVTGKKSYEELSFFYNQAYALIQPAEWDEPFSRTWLEAMQCGLFIISSNNQSAVDVLKQNTLFFKMGNACDLAQKMDIFIQKYKGKKYINNLRIYQADNVMKKIELLYVH